jgi:hypothetical protein
VIDITRHPVDLSRESDWLARHMNEVSVLGMELRVVAPVTVSVWHARRLSVQSTGTQALLCLPLVDDNDHEQDSKSVGAKRPYLSDKF